MAGDGPIPGTGRPLGDRLTDAGRPRPGVELDNRKWVYAWSRHLARRDDQRNYGPTATAPHGVWRSQTRVVATVRWASDDTATQGDVSLGGDDSPGGDCATGDPTLRSPEGMCPPKCLPLRPHHRALPGDVTSRPLGNPR